MKRHMLITVGLSMVLTSTAMASGLMVYPSKNQSPEQQKTDEGACMSWASEQTGFDPTAPMQGTSAPPPRQEPSSSVGKGLMEGALGGLVIGAITGHAGKGAAIGAGTGALVGGVRRNNQVRDSYEDQQAWAEQQNEQYEQAQYDFNRAYATCLQGRGYTVN